MHRKGNVGLSWNAPPGPPFDICRPCRRETSSRIGAFGRRDMPFFKTRHDHVIFRGIGTGSTGQDPLKIQCHKGTYVRSLVRDLGNRLCCGAYVVSLKRLSIGRFNLEDSLPLANLATIGQSFPEKTLLPLDRLLDHFVTYRVPQELEKDVRNGRPIPFDSLARAHWGRIPESGHVALRAENLFCFALPEEKPKGPCCYRPDVVLALGEQR